jgi:hypothetical protein
VSPDPQQPSLTGLEEGGQVRESDESLRFEVAWWRARRAGDLLEVRAVDAASGHVYEALAGPRDGGVAGPRRFLAEAASRAAAAEAGVAVLEDVAAGRRAWPDDEVDVPAVASRR